MNKTVVALYDEYTAANNAVKELVDRGFRREDISLVSREKTEEGEYRVETEDDSEGVLMGAGVGAALGGIGGLLVGAGSLFIPGVGPVLAAGPLVSLLASAGIGAAVGGVTGGLLGALVDMDIPEEHAHGYAEGVRRGGSLVAVRTTDDQTDQVVQVLNGYNPVNIDQRVSEWRQTGWTGFDPNADPAQGTGDMDWPQNESREVPYQDDYDLSDEMAMEEDEDLGPEEHYISDTTQTYREFDYYEPAFRNHFEMSRNRNQYTYDQFRPAYHYGYTLATDERYRGRNWEDLEPEAQRHWENLEPGTWDRFKQVVREAWEDIKEAVR